MQCSASERLRALAHDYFEAVYAARPTYATIIGEHRFDALLDDLSRPALDEYVAQTHFFLSRLRGIESSALGLHDAINWRLLESAMLVALHDHEVRREWQRDPAMYVELPVTAISLQLSRGYAPLGERLAAVASRMAALPRHFETARQNLDCPPRVAVQVAIETTEGAATFFEETVGEVIRDAPSEIASRLAAARDDALAAMRDYLRWLREDLLPRATGDFALGREAFAERLQIEHMIDYSVDEVLAIGRREFDETRRQIVALAAEIDPSRSWERIVEDARLEHPSGEGLLDAYKREIAKLRAFVADRGLAAIPPNEHLDVIATPTFARSTTPYGAYMPPAPFDAEQRGQFWVTPVEPTLPEAERSELLGEHCWAALPSTALHEAYPGHHLQLVRASEVNDHVRKHADSTLFAEGWALYCEQLIGDLGYVPVGLENGDSRLFRLFLLKDQLWRAARIVIDVGLHAGGLTIDESVRMLVDEVKLVEAAARVEVNRYAITPTQPLSYLIGKLEIVRLRDESDELTLGEFHDRLLACGTIPLKLARWEMTGRLDGSSPVVKAGGQRTRIR
jgi:uncharacterized protein (DUF885 family)